MRQSSALVSSGKGFRGLRATAEKKLWHGRGLGDRRALRFEPLEERALLSLDLTVARLTPLGPSGHPFDLLDIQFSKPVQDASFTLGQISLSGPGGPITLSAGSLTPVSATPTSEYHLNLSGLTALATYSLTIGPNILGADDGVPMNQSHDATPGDANDAYKAALLGAGVAIASSDATYDGEALVIDGNTATIDGTHAFDSVEVVGGAVATHSAAITTTTSEINWQLTNGLWVDSTSSINVSGKGYLGGYTAGNSTVGAATGSAGASYGGLGYGWDSSDQPNGTYGDYRDPADLGSGGKGSQGNGGSGGGLVQITAATATIDGDILADGDPGWSGSYAGSGGGGSGGGILLSVGTLSGAGVVSANGGASPPGYAGWGGGGGGGGRVAVYYATLDGFAPAQVSALAGGGVEGAGAVGTVYLKNNGGEGALYVANYGTNPVGSWTPLGISADTEFDVDHLVISGAGVIAAPQHQMAVQANNVDIVNGAELTTQATTTSQEYSLLMSISGTVTVDSTSSIDVSGKGYLGGYTAGNSTAGAATGWAGGSYGGLGYGWDSSDQPNGTYGDYRDPADLGSGGHSNQDTGGSGGGLVHITAATATIDGDILADGDPGWSGSYSPSGGGGSGGGILLSVGTLSGAGVVSANGGASPAGYNGWGGGGGGGGRVAIYTWNANGISLPTANVTASGANGVVGHGQPGTVYFATTPYFTWSSASTSLLHGVEPIAWSALGLDPSQITADISAYLVQQAFPLAVKEPGNCSFSWDTTTVPDGQYQLRVVFHDATGNTVGQLVRQVLVNNSAAWYSGTITTNETWTSNQVNVVYGNVTVAAGVTLTIDPGAVVKFAPGAHLQIVLQSGATLNAPAIQSQPIIFTSLADDTAGGDTNLDGNKSLPEPGDWGGFVVASGATLNLSQYVDLRYLVETCSGTLSGNETWLGTYVYEVTSTVVVPAGVTLSILPGAIVKFDAGAGITVQAGGQLVADATVGQPIVFTSIKDDTAGSDTNGDGNTTQPAAGDWGMIQVQGSATFDHARVLYGANGGDPNNTGAILTNNSAAVVTFNDGTIASSLYDGLYDNGGTINAANDLLIGNDRAVTGHGGVVSIVNCTLDDNVQGVVGHGETVTVVSTLITNSSEWGVYNYGTAPTISYSDVYSTVSGSVNYEGMADQTGANGNISADPKYKNATQGDYRLNYLSPAIDAANGAVAPATDMMGNPRYNDPRTATKTGVADANGHYPDMGAYEFVESASSNLDMVVTAVAGPTAATAGGLATIQWTDANIGAGTVTGPWHDSIYLVSNPGPSQQEIFAGQMLVGQGVTLGPGQSYNVSGQFTVPGDVVANYYWEVKTNSAGDVFEGPNTQNNALVSTVPVYLEVPALPIDGGAVSGQFAAVGQQQWYQFTPQAGQDIQVSLNMADTGGGGEIYIGQGYMPSPSHYDAKQTQWNSSQASALVAGTSAATYYVMVDATSLSGAGSSFTLTAHALGFELDSVSPNVINNTGQVTLQLSGGQLHASMTYQIIDSAGNAYTATSVNVVNSSLVNATFNLPGIPTGAFSVRILSNDPTMQPPSVQAPGGNVTSNDSGNISLKITVNPAEARCDYQYKVTVFISNTGGANYTLPSNLVLIGGSGSQTILPSGTIIAADTINEIVYGGVYTAGSYSPGSTHYEVWEAKVAGTPADTKATETVVQSGDPNDMAAGGFGAQGWVASNEPIPYSILFENMSTASAPASQVVVTDQLSANLDWSTFQLQQIDFNNVEIQVPPGLQSYTTEVYVATDPNPVTVTAALNPETGVVTWTMTSIDPVTGQEVTDPAAGFLPPDNAAGDGEGLVSYSIQPKAGLATGTQITGQATIVFDVNAPMNTRQTLNTIDAVPPTSSVNALPKYSSASFTVSWKGQDDAGGSGIANYTVYVSDNGGTASVWQNATTATSAVFSGTNGHTYAFSVQAIDNVGNQQRLASAAVSTTAIASATILATSQAAGSVVGQSVTFTATVIGPNGIPTGSVTFEDGSTKLGTVPLNAKGVASFSTSALKAGSHTITALYGGNASVPASSGSLTQTVCLGTTNTVLTESASGQSVTLKASVSAAVSGTGVPAGQVTFMAGSTKLGTVSLNSKGVASLTTTSAKTAGQTITASYGGNSSFKASSDSLAMKASHAVTTMVVASSASPSAFGQSVTFTATVSAASGTPTGSVIFKNGTTTLGTGTLTNGVAHISTSALTVGSHTITASYAGTSTFDACSATFAQTVCPEVTITVVSVSANPAVFGQSVTFSATVNTVAPATGMPTGTVTFKDGSTVLGTAKLNAHGIATLSVSTLQVGKQTITVSYAGTTNFSPSSATVTETVNKAATTSTIIASPNPSVVGQSVTFTVTVKPVAPGAGKPTGTVTFYDGASKLGTVTLSTTGKAVFTTSKLTKGSHTIKATYSGDTDFVGGSGSLTQKVAAALMVDASTAPQGSPQLLTDPQLAPIVAAAEQRWAAVDGTQVLAALAGVKVQVADLSGGLLGETVGKTILIDSNAAGYGWFVDPTPALNEEFTTSPSNQQLRAIDPRAVDRIDLLTVVEHELGHVLGLNDLSTSTDDLMSGLLGTGIRRNASYTDAALASQ